MSGCNDGNGLPWVSAALAARAPQPPPEPTETERQAAELETLRAQVALLESLAGRSLETMIQSYQLIASRHARRNGG